MFRIFRGLGCLGFSRDLFFLGFWVLTCKTLRHLNPPPCQVAVFSAEDKEKRRSSKKTPKPFQGSNCS